MKRFLKALLLVLFISLLGFLIYDHLFPFVYKIKEPFFLMPVEFNGNIESVEDLPVRNDEFGDGFYGARRRGGRKHKGIDLAGKLKSPVYASKSGWATFYYFPTGYGNLVIIDHPGKKYQTRYGHLHDSTVKKARWVSQGEAIGTVGKTGNAYNKRMIPHVHFEIRENDVPIDPAKELVKKYNKGG